MNHPFMPKTDGGAMCGLCGFRPRHPVHRAEEPETPVAVRIMDIEVARLPSGHVHVKFVALAGETGPELVMPRHAAEDLAVKLAFALVGDPL